MEFLILAKDGTDPEAMKRRLDAREAHLAGCDKGVKAGEQIVGAALLNPNGDMVGSVLIVDFPDVEALQKWLNEDPYMTGNVWQEVDVIPCRIAPSFEHVKPKKEKDA